MEKKSIPPSIFEPINKLPKIDKSADKSAGKREKFTKLDQYLSVKFLREYFSNK